MACSIATHGDTKLNGLIKTPTVQFSERRLASSMAGRGMPSNLNKPIPITKGKINKNGNDRRKGFVRL